MIHTEDIKLVLIKTFRHITHRQLIAWLVLRVKALIKLTTNTPYKAL